MRVVSLLPLSPKQELRPGVLSQGFLKEDAWPRVRGRGPSRNRRGRKWLDIQSSPVENAGAQKGVGWIEGWEVSGIIQEGRADRQLPVDVSQRIKAFLKNAWSLSKALFESTDCVGGWGGRRWLGLEVGQSSECKTNGQQEAGFPLWSLESDAASQGPCYSHILAHSFFLNSC